MELTSGIETGAGNASFSRRAVRLLSPVWFGVVFLAAALAPGAQARDLAGASRSSDTLPLLAQAPKTSPGDLQASPEQEQPTAEMLARELAAARRDLALLLTLLTKARDETAQVKREAERETADLRKALQEEHDRAKQPGQVAEGSAEALRRSMLRDRADRMERDLVTMRRGGEQAAAPAAKTGDQPADSGIAELQKSLKQEQERAARLEQDLSAARRDAEKQTALAAKASSEMSQTKRTADSSVAELQKSLKQERERASRLEQDLAAARHDVEKQTALAAKASDEASRTKRSADSVAELQKSLKQERDRAAHLEQDLAAARRDVEKQTALAAKAGDEASQTKRAVDSDVAQLRKSLNREWERTAHLERDLAAARGEVEKQTTLAIKASDEADKLKHAAESGFAELRKALQQERERAAQLAHDLALARSTQNVSATSVTTSGQARPDRQREAEATKTMAAEHVAVAAARAYVQPRPEDAAEVARLIARAAVLLEQGDVGSARMVLERAAETGDAQASFSLAETYDPLILPKWGTYGTRGDAARARDLYARAEAGGIKEAKERAAALRRSRDLDR